MDTYGL